MADLKPIPAREFERFLIAKGASIDCATCGHSPITIHDEQLAGKHAALVANNFPTFQPLPAVHYSLFDGGMRQLRNSPVYCPRNCRRMAGQQSQALSTDGPP